MKKCTMVVVSAILAALATLVVDVVVLKPLRSPEGLAERAESFSIEEKIILQDLLHKQIILELRKRHEENPVDEEMKESPPTPQETEELLKE